MELNCIWVILSVVPPWVYLPLGRYEENKKASLVPLRRLEVPSYTSIYETIGPVHGYCSSGRQGLEHAVHNLGQAFEHQHHRFRLPEEDM